MQGCFKPAPRANVVLGIKFERCPVTYRCAASYRVVNAFDEGFLTAAYETRRVATPKKIQAVRYVEYLKKLRASHDY